MFRRCAKLLIFAVLSTQINLAVSDTLRVANGEWLPYFSQSRLNGGVSSHIASEAFGYSGYKTEYVWLPWKEGLDEARNGNLDAAIGWAATPKRTRDFLFSDPILEGRIVFFHLRTKDFDWNDLPDLRKHKIVAIKGFTYHTAFIKAEQANRIHVIRVDNELDALNYLLSAKADIFICNLDVGIASVKAHLPRKKQKQITHHPRAFHVNQLRVAFPRVLEASKKRLKHFNEGLDRLKRNGSFDEFYRKQKAGGYL